MNKEELKQEIRNAYKEGFNEGMKHSRGPNGIPNWEYDYLESRAFAVVNSRWTRSEGLLVFSAPFKGEQDNPIPPIDYRIVPK